LRGGFDGFTSMRLMVVRRGIRKSITTASAISCGATFQSGRGPLGGPLKSVSVLPGSTCVTRTLSYRWSSMVASESALRPALDALYPAPPAKGEVDDKELTFT